MTSTTREVFEKYQVRKTKKQKSAFIEYVNSVAEEHGYTARVEKGMLGARNIVIGDPETAKVVYTAHYDTCPRLPFPNFLTPKHLWIYLLYQIALVVGFLVVAYAIGFVIGVIFALLGWNADLAYYCGLFIYWGLLALILFGPANKNTANDNTSGVTTLLDVMISLPAERKDQVAFVFFDLEEVGLFGSASFASKHKTAMKEKLLVNFDCVSDGEHILLVLRRGALAYRGALAQAFEANEDVTVEIASKGVFYPSDQGNFPCGVGVASFKKTKRRGILYINRIHTKKDTAYREENIAFLRDGAKKLVELL